MLKELAAIAKTDASSPEGASAPYKTVRDLIGNGFRSISSTEAGQIVKAFRLPIQDRDLNAAGAQHIEVLAALMQRGQWRSKDAINFAKIGDKIYIVNGHHRLSAQELSGRTIEWTFVVHDCATNADVEKLFYSFDTNTRIRTNKTILGAIGFASQLNVSKTMADALYRAVPLIANEFYTGKLGRDVVAERLIDTRLDLARQYSREIALYETCIANAPVALKRRLVSNGAVAVALVTLKFQPERAVAFWKGIGENDGLRKGDPRHTYIIALTTPGARAGTSAWTVGAAAMCWRAWYQNRDLTRVQVIEGGKVAIAGTPYRGK